MKLFLRYFRYIFCITVFLITVGHPFSSPRAELLFRGGYLTKFLSTSSGDYNKFLKNRYGASSPMLSGSALSASFRKTGGKWGVGLEVDDLKGSIRYKTLNGEKQENTLQLQNTMALLEVFPGRFPSIEIDFGFGTNKLTRDFYGYQDADIVSTNVSASEGSQKATTKGTVMMGQLLYNLWGERYRIELGGRYSVSRHTISVNDSRPAYNSVGVPTLSVFDLGGLEVLGTLTFKF